MNNTKLAIRETFIALYSKQPFEKMSIRELCARTPVARTTFYGYYGNLGALKAEIEDDLIRGILDIADVTCSDVTNQQELQSFFEKTLAYIKAHWVENYAFLVRQPNFEYISKWKDAIKIHCRHCFPGKDNAPNHGVILEVIASAVISAYTYWMEHPDEVDAAKLAGISVQMLDAAERII